MLLWVEDRRRNDHRYDLVRGRPLTAAPLGWRAGWWHFRFSLLTLLPWAAYFGIAALVVSVLALLLGRSRIQSRGVAFSIIALIIGGLVAYVPWHYDRV